MILFNFNTNYCYCLFDDCKSRKVFDFDINKTSTEIVVGVVADGYGWW